MQTFDHIIMAAIGEIALKGLNRKNFEQALVKNMRRKLGEVLRPYPGVFYEVRAVREKIQCEFTYDPEKAKALPSSAPADLPAELTAEERQAIIKKAVEGLRDCFGIVYLTVCTVLPQDYDELLPAVLAYAQEVLPPLLAKKSEDEPLTFKFESKRADKAYPKNSYEINCDAGGILLENIPGLKVSVTDPEVAFQIEVRDQIFLYHDKIQARRGLPLGVSGRALQLLSGGIDSPVAAYRMASRGLIVEYIYFHTFPYTSDQTKQKVLDLAQILHRYTGPTVVHVVDFTQCMLTISKACPEEMLTVVMRRMMVRVSDALAERRKLKALITGESLGQVASQTLEALVATDEVAKHPVFRPLIGTDKTEIIDIAQDIGTYDTSILPYEDCCTVFVSRHPRTRPSLGQVYQAEADLDIEALLADVMKDKITSIPIDLS